MNARLRFFFGNLQRDDDDDDTDSNHSSDDERNDGMELDVVERVRIRDPDDTEEDDDDEENQAWDFLNHFSTYCSILL